MNAVAMMTPDPKYLQRKNTHFGTLMLLDLAAMMGRSAPDIALAPALYAMCRDRHTKHRPHADDEDG